MASVRSPSSAHSHSPLTVSSAPQKSSMMRCPKCGDEQKKSDICAECGVVVEKYLKIKQSSNYEHAPTGGHSYMNDVEEKTSVFSFNTMVAVGVLAIVVALVFVLVFV
jgi:uncharacterized membrane protein YvbJ